MENTTPAFYNVMLLEWRGALVERRDIGGSIHKEAFLQSLSSGHI